MDTLPLHGPQEPARRSGIYRITCIPTGKFYIGSAVNMRKRWRQHRKMLLDQTHFNRRLQNSWNKYGEAAFRCDEVERCDPKDLISREQFHLDAADACRRGLGLNINPTAGSSLGKKMSQRQRNKRCRAYILTDPQGVTYLSRNLRRFCKEHGLSYGAMHKGVDRGWRCQREHEPAIADSKSKWWIVTYPDGSEETVLSLSRFCKRNGLQYAQMLRVSKGRVRQCRGFRCRPDGMSTSEWESRLVVGAPGASSTRTYRVTSPSGEVMVVENLLAFCREKGLCSRSMYTHHFNRGWRCERIA